LGIEEKVQKGGRILENLGGLATLTAESIYFTEK